MIFAYNNINLIKSSVIKSTIRKVLKEDKKTICLCHDARIA